MHGRPTINGICIVASSRIHLLPWLLHRDSQGVVGNHMVLEQSQPQHDFYSEVLMWKPRLIGTQVSYTFWLVKAASILSSAEVLYFSMPCFQIISRSVVVL